MAVLRRVEPIGDRSKSLAMSTVVGMVLGVLSLFALVAAYQFIPRKRRTKSPALAALAPPRPPPRPLLTRIRLRCTTLLTSLSRRRKPSPEEGPTQQQQQQGHRTLRSFHLTPERKRERESTRKTFANALRLNLKIDIPKFGHDRSPAASPRPPKRCYTRMKDPDSMCESLVAPGSATLSPWSPSEEYYPRTPPPRFKATASPVSSPRSPPPLYPPPPAYVPGTPIRGALLPSEDLKKRYGIVDPFDDGSRVDGEDNEKEDTASLMAEIDEVIRITMTDSRTGRHDDSFVIGEGDDDDVGSLSECSM